MIYVTADTHFGHDSIIEYCNRPFKSANDMDNKLIKNFNIRINDEDDLFILGDFTLSHANNYGYFQSLLKRLHGRKHLIMGNHDHCKPAFYNEIGFQSIHYPYFELNGFILCHDPALSEAAKDRRFLCGHVHTLFLAQRNVLNVGVDQHAYNPLRWDEAKKLWEQRCSVKEK